MKNALLMILLSAQLKVMFAACPFDGNVHAFGPQCEYQCHCKGTARCDEKTGACIECETGWLGPSCQFQNAAEGATVDGQYVTDLPYATDGNLDTCTTQTPTDTNPFIRVSFKTLLKVKEVQVNFKNYSAIPGFSVYVGVSSARDQNSLCGTQNQAVVNGNRVSVVCPRLVEALFITVQANGQTNALNVCEIEVPIGRHLSFRKPAYSSTTEAGNIAKYVVSGHIRDMLNTRFEDNPWWYVDLGTKYRIDTIRVWNREFAEHFNVGFQVFVSNSTEFPESDLVYTDTGTAETIKTVIYVPVNSVMARFVRVSIPKPARLHLREVWVLGGCPYGYCGLNCDVSCNCESDVISVKDELLGTCVGECAKNWKKVGGYCNTSQCAAGRFGYECKYTCHCDGRCDPWTGRCLDQTSTCRKHYYGTICQAYNLIKESLYAAQGDRTYQNASVTVDGNLASCGPILTNQGSWVAPIGTRKLVDQVFVRVNENTTGFGLEVFTDDGGQNTMRCEVSRLIGTGKFIARCKNTIASHIRLGTKSTLQICEVAMLECAARTFGLLCESMCHCANNALCDRISGRCPSGGCASGYYGVNCDRECQTGYYGNQCVNRCGRCALGVTCDKFTGECPGDCQPGWLGALCDTECPDGLYGVNCQYKCGLCLDGDACRKDSGLCDRGCNPGYRAGNCSLECESGTYGYNCNMTCGQCANNQFCDVSSGVCLNGCVRSKQPPYCQTDCDFGTFGENCVSTCGNCRDNVTCNPLTGICRYGCDPGVFVSVTSPVCRPECTDGYYGYNCTQKCLTDTCAGRYTCNKVNGGCINGCLYPGYQPPYCVTECNPGTYGLGCASLCGMCKNKDACNVTTGVCPNGCEQGYDEPRCESDPLSGRLSTASVVVMSCGLVLAMIGIVVGVFVYCVYKERIANPFKKRPQQQKSVKSLKQEDISLKSPRSVSLVSRVYENNLTPDAESGTPLKRCNSNNLLGDTQMKGTILVKNLWRYMHADKKGTLDELRQQFKEMAYGLLHPCEAAKKSQNLKKNRYKEIFAYDHSRVKLEPVRDDTGNDYINACFISGYNKPHMYIASQGPTDEIKNDFWRMIWQKKCRKIVMLTRLVENNKIKCSQYWPDEGEEKYGSISVEFKAVDSYADYDVRTFLISAGDEEKRELKQFHFEAWPDRQVPEYASCLINFWSKVRTTDLKDNVPTLVHCSAGIGRTGAYLALDYLMDQAEVEGYVNVQQCVQNLRHQRVRMVQTQEQYVFVHEALVEALFCPSTVIPYSAFSQVYTNMLEYELKLRKTKLQLEFEKLQRVTKFGESMKPSFYENEEYRAARAAVNEEKNRTKFILPSDNHRPWLTTRVQGRNDYINAVYLPSHRDDKVYIVTQNPYPDTIVDFWRMVYENTVATIVTMDKVNTVTETFWPVVEEIVTFIPFTLHHVAEVDHGTFIERTIKLLNAEEPREKARTIKQFECKFWLDDSLPMASDGILAVHDHVTRWQKTQPKHPVVVNCMNGATKSGLYCVVSATIERLKQERDVAIQQTIKQMRIRRHQIIPNYDQYRLCHDVIVDFLRGFDTYSNFYI